MCFFALVKTSSNRMWKVHGPCNKNILKSPDRTCIIDEMNLSMRDYLMYNFKLNLLYENFSDTNL